MIEFQLGDWLPEQADYKNPGLEGCLNVIPRPDGYSPARQTVGTGESVAGNIIGAFGYTRSGGVQGVCVATTSDIYTIVLNTVTASGLSLGLTTGDAFTFEQFGASVYATCKGSGTYYLGDIESDLTFSAGTGSPPDGNAMGRVGEFLVLGDITDLDASDQPNRLRWSRFNDPDSSWVTDIAYQSGAVTLGKEQGNITHISGGDFGLVFQERGISRLTYTGGAAVFAKELYENNRGCPAPKSVVRVGPRAYFMSHDGFFVTDGASVEPISRGRIWGWFRDNVNQALVSETQGACDWPNRCVVWSFSTGDNTEKTHQLYFNWESGRWSVVERTLDYLVVSGRSAESLESIATDYPNLDTIPFSLDSGIFRESDRSLMAFDGGELSELDGSPLAAQFETGDFHPFLGRRSFISGVTPLITNDSENTTVEVGVRNTMTSTPFFSQPATVGAIGYAATNVDGRYFRVRMNVPVDTEWTDAFGFQVHARASGVF